MFLRTNIPITSLAIAAAFIFAGCDAETEDSPASTDSTSTESDSETEVEVEVAVETIPDDATEEVEDDGDICTGVVTAEELDEILGSSIVDFPGGSKFCNITFASDSIGTLSVYSGDEADEAMEFILTKFEGEENTTGVVLEDGRGLILENSVIVRGDSERVFRLDLPDNLEVEDKEAAKQAIVDLLMPR